MVRGPLIVLIPVKQTPHPPEMKHLARDPCASHQTDQLAAEAAFSPIHTLRKPIESGSIGGQILDYGLRRVGRIFIEHPLR